LPLLSLLIIAQHNNYICVEHVHILFIQLHISVRISPIPDHRPQSQAPPAQAAASTGKGDQPELLANQSAPVDSSKGAQLQAQKLHDQEFTLQVDQRGFHVLIQNQR